jgi:hypothetical protein
VAWLLLYLDKGPKHSGSTSFGYPLDEMKRAIGRLNNVRFSRYFRKIFFDLKHLRIRGLTS